MENAILEIIYKSQLSDNQVRSQAERDFFGLTNNDPSAVSNALTNVSLNNELPSAVKQSALLYLKRIISLHWSLGFETFAGNPINFEVKSYIRSSLLSLISEAADTKIRNVVSNIIVVIALVDFPDEWPDLLKLLYSLIDTSNPNVTQNSMLGGLHVLHELLDDLITDEQFFEGFVGVNTLNYCISLLAAPTVPSAAPGQNDNNNKFYVPLVIKNQVAQLLEIALKQLQGPEVFSNPNRSQVVSTILPKALDLLLSLVKEQYNYAAEIVGNNINILNIENVLFSQRLYQILTFLVDNFNKRLFNNDLKSHIQEVLVNHLTHLNHFYYNTFVASQHEANGEKFIVHNKSDGLESLDPATSLKDLLIQIIQLLGSLSDQSISSKPQLLATLLNNFIILNTIPFETYESYFDNFNLFVTDETEMSGQFSVRNAVSDYLSDLPTKDSNAFLSAALDLLNDQRIASSWRNKESLLSILESIFLNEDDDDDDGGTSLLTSSINFVSVFERLLSLANDRKNNPSVIARSILTLAKFLEKFGSNFPNFNDLSHKALTNNLSIATTIRNDEVVQSEGVVNDLEFDKESNDSLKLIQSAALISITYFNNFLKLSDSNLQHQVQKILYFLIDEAEEDTPAVLLEALTISINIDLKHTQSSTDDIALIFKIASVDFSNIMIVQSAKDSLETLLTDISDDAYLKQCEFALPSLVESLNESINDGNNAIEYTPKLNMALELLNIFIQSCPSQHDLPESLFTFIFAPLSGLLIQAVDDQILQIGGEVFNTVLVNSNEKYFIDYTSNSTGENGIHIILKILEKFLSPELSDSAAMNVGSIVVSIVQKFNEHLNQYIPQILESATRRLIIAQHTIIIENLITVFCYLVLLSPTETLNFLGSLNFEVTLPSSPGSPSLEPQKVTQNGICVVLPIWLDSFTTTRGFEKIKKNIFALGKIFLLNDSRVENLIVRGDPVPNQANPDLIITRSMARKIPATYTQISAPLKILKLLIQELSFQQQQPDPNEYITKATDGGAGDDDGWEDLEDVGVANFNKLKSYVDEDNVKSSLNDESSQDLKAVLTNFLKECIQANTEKFGGYYEQLNDQEKKILTEVIGF